MQQPKGFELHKCYEHLGRSKLHTIALAKESEMWIVNKDKGMLIAEGRDGSLQQISTDVESAANWYEITRDIFINDENFVEFKFPVGKDTPIDEIEDIYKIELAHDYRLRIYKNGKTYLFDLANYYDEHGLLKNLVEENSAKVLDLLKDVADAHILTRIEKMLFERI